LSRYLGRLAASHPTRQPTSCLGFTTWQPIEDHRIPLRLEGRHRRLEPMHARGQHRRPGACGGRGVEHPGSGCWLDSDSNHVMVERMPARRRARTGLGLLLVKCRLLVDQPRACRSSGHCRDGVSSPMTLVLMSVPPSSDRAILVNRRFTPPSAVALASRAGRPVPPSSSPLDPGLRAGRGIGTGPDHRTRSRQPRASRS
jgi:hypothetical protein